MPVPTISTSKLLKLLAQLETENQDEQQWKYRLEQNIKVSLN